MAISDIQRLRATSLALVSGASRVASKSPTFPAIATAATSALRSSAAQNRAERVSIRGLKISGGGGPDLKIVIARRLPGGQRGRSEQRLGFETDVRERSRDRPGVRLKCSRKVCASCSSSLTRLRRNTRLGSRNRPGQVCRRRTVMSCTRADRCGCPLIRTHRAKAEREQFQHG